MKETSNKAKPDKEHVPIVSHVTDQGHLLELVYDPLKERIRFAHWDGNKSRLLDTFCPDEKTRLVPMSGTKALIDHDVIRLASEPESYGETSDLVEAVRAYIHRYVDLAPDFERLAAQYVLLTWVHDRFNELPYLRRRGEFGTGKTRFLTVIGSICYKPIFAGGASTVSPIFHLLDKIGGTLLIDEADYRFSDENAQIAKILNSGNVRGFSVLRSESVNGKDFRPRAFRVFGPKIVAMRGRYDDAALESRFLSETSTIKKIRRDIPINVTSDLEAEALVLRNKLLMYRFRNFANVGAPELVDIPAFEPRMQQILSPLFAVAATEEDKLAILNHAQDAQLALNQARGLSVEAEVLRVIRLAMAKQEGIGVAVQEIARMHGRAYLRETGKPMSPKAMGAIIRTRLNLSTRKSHGVFVVPRSEEGALAHLYERYQVTDEDVDHLREVLGMHSRVDYGDFVDFERNA